MIPKIKQFFRVAGQSAAAAMPARASGSAAPAAGVRPIAQSLKLRPKVVVIGVSTGGPTALGAMLPSFPHEFPVADSGGAAYATSLYPVARRASQRDLPTAGRGSKRG